MRDDTPTRTLRAIGVGVLRVGAVAFAVGFLAFHVHRRSGQGKAFGQITLAAQGVPPNAETIATATMALATWLKAIEPPPTGPVVFSSSKVSPMLSPGEASRMLKARVEREEKIAGLLAPLREAYRGGKDDEVRQALHRLGFLIDANHRASINPSMDDPTKTNQFKTHAVVEVWNRIMSPEPGRPDAPPPPPSRGPGLGTALWLSPPKSIQELSRPLEVWLAEPSGDPANERENLAKAIEPLWRAYLGSGGPKSRAQQIELWQQLFEMGLAINSDNFAYVSPTRGSKPRVYQARLITAIAGWNTLTTASENARMAVSLGAENLPAPPATVAREMPIGMSMETHLPVASMGLSDWLAATDENPAAETKLRAELSAHSFGYAYERGQAEGVRQRFEKWGIRVDENHRAILDEARVKNLKANREKVQALVDAWNTLAPKPRAPPAR